MMGVGETALRLNSLEATLNRQPYSDGLLEEVIRGLSVLLSPNADLHASSEYRLYLAGQLLKRTFKAAWNMASTKK